MTGITILRKIIFILCLGKWRTGILKANYLQIFMKFQIQDCLASETLTWNIELFKWLCDSIYGPDKNHMNFDWQFRYVFPCEETVNCFRPLGSIGYVAPSICMSLIPLALMNGRLSTVFHKYAILRRVIKCSSDLDESKYTK